MRNYNLLEIDLQLFNGAAGGAAAAGGEGAAQATEGALPKAETKSGSGSSRRSRSGAFYNVVFGKQEDASAAATAADPAAGGNAEGNGKSGITTTSDTLEARRKAFRDMVNGEYKDIYTEETQQIINRRFKENKVMEASLNAQKPILDMLMQRYQIGDGDMAKLQAAIEEDNAYWQEAADRQGLTVEQYKERMKLMRENAEFRAMADRRAGEQAAQQQMARWVQESESVRGIYPNFDLSAEMQNGHFRDLLKKGVPVKQAFELIHMDEIREAAARSAAKTASEQMEANIKFRAARPSENGTSSKSAVIVKNDVGNLTREERAEIARRSQRGEKIKF